MNFIYLQCKQKAVFPLAGGLFFFLLLPCIILFTRGEDGVCGGFALVLLHDHDIDMA